MNPEIEIENIDLNDDVPERIDPDFSNYKPDIEAIEALKREKEFENLVVIGNGGSITSFRALYYAFHEEVDSRVFIVTTQDPDHLRSVEKRTGSEDTLVVPISKSGSTTTVIESLMFFLEREYEVLPVTSRNDGALRSIVERRGLDSVEHPDVGGRFSGGTETALVPAALAGLDIEEIREGVESGYESMDSRENIAEKTARALHSAEQDGFHEILAPFYSTRLFGFYPLLVQLMHETVAKEGQGQTLFGDLGPEYQHHTNQRLFGGRENIVPMFFRTGAHERESIKVPEDLEEVGWKDRKLGELGDLDYSDALDSEYLGVKGELENLDRPHITVTLEEMNYRAAGEFMAFLQYLAVYSARLRGVDPYTQPEVEKSKEIGFRQRFER